MNSTIFGYHVYETVRTPFVGKVLSLNPESRNSHDHFTVSVIKDGDVVGHVPIEISQAFFTSCNTMEPFLLKSLDTENLVMD